MDTGAILILIGAYLCGSIPSGLWLGRLGGVDVEATGSGNIGATNVARAGGLRLGLATLILDVSKGAVPVLFSAAVGAAPGVPALVGLSAILGHMFSIFARFKGGKGVATTAGAFLVLSPLALVGALAVFIMVAVGTRIASLASLSAAVSLPVLVAVFDERGLRLAVALVVTVALFVTHRDNLRRFARGTEPQFRSGKSSAGDG